MIILPAIDLYEGKVVRLKQGDYKQMTVYSEDPAATAGSFFEAGATHLHVVDLEGARDGNTANFETIKMIARQSGLRIQVGGGVRSVEVIEKYASLGVERVILGTAAVTDQGFVAETVKAYGGLIAVGVDVKDGRAAIKGWTETTDKDGIEFCHEMESIGVKTIICTNISRDGVLGGTDMELYRAMVAGLSVNIIASGGVTALEEITELKQIGVYGAILGNALYRGKIDLKEALARVR